MKQIKKVIIKNFQCHKKTVIKPAESGLTVITGPTDHGKSAVVRALRWLMFNKPQGDDFIRHGSRECQVIAELVNGDKVVRRRTASLNQYWINDECFEGFGNEVPLEVQQALGVYSYDIAGETLELNVAKQLEGPFLGSSVTAPTRAKILGKLAGTEAIDQANKQLGTDIYRAKQKKKKLKKEINEKKADIDDYSWVEPLGEVLKKAEEKMELIEEKQEKLKRLKEIQEQLKEVKRNKNEIRDHLKRLAGIGEILILDILNMSDKLQQLKRYSAKLSKLREKKPDIRFKLSHLSEIENVGLKIKTADRQAREQEKLIPLASKLGQLTLKRSWTKTHLEKLARVQEVWEKINLTGRNRNEYNQLQHIQEQLHQVRLEKTEISNELDVIGSPGQVIKTLNKIETKQDKVKIYQDKSSTLAKLQEVIPVKRERIKQQTEQAKQYRTKYQTLLNQAGFCPTCGAAAKDHDMEKVV